MIIRTVPVGELQVNCCLISRDEASPLLVVDPGAEAEKLLKEINGRPVAAILLTHGHFDHIGALDAFPDVPVYMHPLDAEMLSDPEKNGSRGMGGCEVIVCRETLPAEEGMTISLAGIDVTVWHTPGHSPGSVCYLTKECIFTGDTLFHRGYGRTDLFGGSFRDIRTSLKRILFSGLDLPFIPGHGEGALLSDEK